MAGGTTRVSCKSCDGAHRATRVTRDPDLGRKVSVPVPIEGVEEMNSQDIFIGCIFKLT